jgi:hypothetical protein
VPVPIFREPLLPALAVPVLSTSSPLTPNSPALEVVIAIDPLVVTVLYPDFNVTNPPVVEVVVPAFIFIKPPWPLFPDPTVMVTEPPLPRVADPEPMKTFPLFPLLEVPVLNITRPLTPLLPALADCNRRLPDVDTEL